MSRASAFHDPAGFPFVRELESAFEPILAEMRDIAPSDYVESPDSLTIVRDGFDETGWLSFPLFGDEPACQANRRRCPATVRACSAVPGLVNAGFSLFRPGTHLHPHRGERVGVLRCHLPLSIPAGDVGLRSGDETRRWQPGKCLILDDTLEHEAWNHGGSDRVVLIVTFEASTARRGADEDR